MMRLVVAILVLGLTAVAGDASAMSFTLDSYAKSVERPASGFVDVDFTGTIVVADGFKLTLMTVDPIETASGEVLDLLFPTFPVCPNLTGVISGVIFSVRVLDTDAPGHYAFGVNAGDPLTVSLTECPIGGGQCQGASVDYALDVVERAVPEPASVALLSMAVAGLAVRRRRRER